MNSSIYSVRGEKWPRTYTYFRERHKERPVFLQVYFPLAGIVEFYVRDGAGWRILYVFSLNGEDTRPWNG